MSKKIHFSLLVFFLIHASFAQKNKNDLLVGFSYGFGHELKNKNYTFENKFYKAHVGYIVKQLKQFRCELILEPEINLASHRLINPFFITTDDPDYLMKIEYYSKTNRINQYILNFGVNLRKPISNAFSFFVLGSVGPLISDVETERLAKGFALSNTLAIGFDLEINSFTIEIKPSFRHVSNAGLSSPNFGFNTQNFEFGIFYKL
ncbi:acyloxyacyl hydrolase [Flavobacterium sp. WC2430]|uniref:acyloxyacyl hydrolase n=1 Tax=Flavobacterium sp. WC2430 TaxID=3234137 RepID=UPI0034670DF1